MGFPFHACHPPSGEVLKICVFVLEIPLETSTCHCWCDSNHGSFAKKRSRQVDVSSQPPQFPAGPGASTCWLLGVYREQGLGMGRKEGLTPGISESSGHEVAVGTASDIHARVHVPTKHARQGRAGSVPTSQTGTLRLRKGASPSSCR